MGLSEAAAATGVNRSMIYRAWKAGRMSAARNTGQIEVEPVELFRVFPPVAQQRAGEATHPRAQADATAEIALRDSALASEVQLLREMLDAMREDRDAWREQARKEGDEWRELAQRLALAAPAAAPPARWKFWRRAG